MKVYLIMDVNNLTKHELIEVRHSEEKAQARVDELNDLNKSSSWTWDEREVEGLATLDPKKWLFLSNLIEMLQDEQEPDVDPKITLQSISDIMNEENE